MVVMSYPKVVRAARITRGWSQYKLWRRIEEIFGEAAICLATLKRTEKGIGRASEVTRSQIARVLPETR